MGTAYEILGIALGITMLVASTIFNYGWIVLLVMGIVRQKRAKNGLKLIIISGVWVLALIGLGIFALRHIGPVEKFDPMTYKGTMGRIELSYTGESKLTLYPVGKPKKLEVPVTNGTALAPTGNYTLMRCDITAKGQDNQDWTESCSLYSPGPNHISIQKNTPYKLQLGLPLNASVSVKPESDGKVMISLIQTGTGNVNTSTWIQDQGGWSWSPGFQVLDKAGNVIWQDKFAYGTHQYSGRVPSNVKGDVIIRPIVKGCPFKVKIIDTKWMR